MIPDLDAIRARLNTIYPGVSRTDTRALLALVDDLQAEMVRLNARYDEDWEIADQERARADAAEDEVERLQAREVHFARVLRVPDGGEYLNDWDSRLTGLLAEVERLHTALARLVGSAHPYGRTDVVTVSVPFLEEARTALRTDPEEKE